MTATRLSVPEVVTALAGREIDRLTADYMGFPIMVTTLRSETKRNIAGSGHVGVIYPISIQLYVSDTLYW